jgi:hypothetical protein
MFAVDSKVEPPHRSFLQKLHDAADAMSPAGGQDPWEPVLRKLRGRTAPDGIERVSTCSAFDALEIPVRRRPSQTVRLSRLMRRLGWENIRARGLNPGRTRMRGFARIVPGHSAAIRLPNEF